MMYCIYRVVNNMNGKTYIGQHRYTDDANPMKGYIGSGILLRKAYKKYGFENFSIEVLYKRIQYKETADSMEIWMIEKERKENKNGCYNIANGGGGSSCKGRTPWNKGKTNIYSDETRKRIGEASKQFWQNEEYRQNQLEKHRGKKLSKEHRQHISEGNKGRVVSKETRKKISKAHKGKKFSEETRKKISESKKGTPTWNKGIHATEESKLKNSIAHKGRKHFNNGVVSILAYECPEGFVPGRIYKRRNDNVS